MLLNFVHGLPLLAASAALTALLIIVLRPWLIRYAMARPNARSSHRVPTPQGGGAAVIFSVALLLAIAAAWGPVGLQKSAHLVGIIGAALTLAVVGAVDDIRIIEPIPRLLLQAAAVLVVVTTLPLELRIVPAIPFWLERALMILGLTWFVNLVNFMDGLDWITVAEVVPVTAALSVIGQAGALPIYATVTALALCGAMLGFAPFNKPVARLFLGDVGSLPIGLILGWLLILLAEKHLAAAILLPLYYLADATITLVQRFLRGEAVMQPHRSHFYQRAADGGMPSLKISARVFVVNCVLAGLAGTSFAVSPPLQLFLVAAGAALVSALLNNFVRTGEHK